MVTANEEVAWGYNKQRQCQLVQEAALLAIESVDAPKSKIQKKKLTSVIRATHMATKVLLWCL